MKDGGKRWRRGEVRVSGKGWYIGKEARESSGWMAPDMCLLTFQTVGFYLSVDMNLVGT